MTGARVSAMRYSSSFQTDDGGVLNLCLAYAAYLLRGKREREREEILHVVASCVNLNSRWVQRSNRSIKMPRRAREVRMDGVHVPVLSYEKLVVNRAPEVPRRRGRRYNGDGRVARGLLFARRASPPPPPRRSSTSAFLRRFA